MKKILFIYFLLVTLISCSNIQNDVAQPVTGSDVSQTTSDGKLFSGLNVGGPQPDFLFMALDGGASRTMRIRSLNDMSSLGVGLVGSQITLAGFGSASKGADIGITNLNGNNSPDVIVASAVEERGGIVFKYKIGYDIDAYGNATSWSTIKQSPVVLGSSTVDIGIAIGELDGNTKPEIIFMAVAQIGSIDHLYDYVVTTARNVNSAGNPEGWGPEDPTGWGDPYYLPVPSNDPQGAGIALIGNITGLVYPELMFTMYDNNHDLGGSENTFRYFIGKDVQENGNPLSETPIFVMTGVGAVGEGAGIGVTNLDGDPKPDVVFMAYDAPSGANSFRYRIGYNIQGPYGAFQSESVGRIIEGVGWSGLGAGIAVRPRP